MSIVTWDDGPHWKPQRGSATLEREKADKERESREQHVAKAVKARDGRCRWPEAHKCRGMLEAVHIVDKKMGGDHGLVTDTGNVVTLCRWIHRAGPESIHGKQLKVEKETERGADGPLSFWRQTDGFDALGQPVYAMVARESSPGVIERD